MRSNISCEIKNYPEVIKKIKIPTLIIHSRKDPYIPLGHSRRLEKDIKNARLIIIEDGGHFLPVDWPGIVAKEIEEFV